MFYMYANRTRLRRGNCSLSALVFAIWCRQVLTPKLTRELQKKISPRIRNHWKHLSAISITMPQSRSESPRIDCRSNQFHLKSSSSRKDPWKHNKVSRQQIGLLSSHSGRSLQCFQQIRILFMLLAPLSCQSQPFSKIVTFQFI